MIGKKFTVKLWESKRIWDYVEVLVEAESKEQIEKMVSDACDGNDSEFVDTIVDYIDFHRTEYDEFYDHTYDNSDLEIEEYSQ